MLSFFIILMRKMLKSKWLVLTLLIGMTISTALLSSIPAYTNGILQKMLLKELQGYQTYSGLYPGGMNIRQEGFTITLEDSVKLNNILDAAIPKIPERMPMPLLAEAKYVRCEGMRLFLSQNKKDKKEYNNFALSAYTNLEKHIRITDGKMPSKSAVNGVYEGIVTEETMDSLDLVVGNEYEVSYGDDDSQLIRVRISGVFDMKETKDMYWFKDFKTNRDQVFLYYDLLNQDFVQKYRFSWVRLEWYLAFDYQALKLADIDQVVSVDKAIREELRITSGSNVAYNFPMIKTIDSFAEKKQQILTIMLSINIPVLVMLGLFMLMVALLKIEREKNEIAVLVSRGAGKIQVFLVYLAEGLVLASFAMLLGPLTGILMCRLIGSSNGFLEFVNRNALDVSLQQSSYIYALWGAVFSVLMLAVPAYFSAGKSVVMRKQYIARLTNRAFWQKIYVDVILLAVSCYGIYLFGKRQRDLIATGLMAKSLEIDPLLFIAPAIFIIAVGLVFLRIFPLLVRLLFGLTNRFLRPSGYAILLAVSRSLVQYHFIMLFLIFTIALGLFSANSARTMNGNVEEKVKYAVGADVVIQPKWEKLGGNTPLSGPGMPRQQQSTTSGSTQYIEPVIEQYSKLKGVQLATKVYSSDKSVAYIDEKSISTHLMAIDTEEFGQMAWFRNDLLPHHWYEYLNMISQEPASVLISKSLTKASGIKPGDMITLRWGDSGSAPVIVYGIIDYWPTWNPNPKVSELNEDGKKKYLTDAEPTLIVANFQYIQDNMSLEPYNIWLKLKPDAKKAEFYDDIVKRNIQITNLVNMNEELVKAKNDPFQMAVNGALTLGFIISSVICLIGFILYWTLSIRARELQFGIFRAVGFLFRQLLSMLLWEQMLVSATAISIGAIIGKVTSNIFVPFFQLSYSSYQQVPPFRIVVNTSDHMKLYTLVGAMSAAGIIILAFLVSRIKTAQALKLGED